MVLLDRIGYAFYRDAEGRAFLPAGQFDVRLVTSLAKAGEASGDELASVLAVDGHDERALIEAVRFQSTFGGRKAARLVAVTERFLLLAARLRDELGIPGQGVAQTLPFRDKVVMKEHLARHGIKVPAFAPFTEAAARELLRSHRAVVAKPRLGTGSVEITVLRDEAELAAFTAAHAGRLADFEVEQFVTGRLYHVDSMVQDSKVVAAIAGGYIDETTSYQRLRPCRDVAVPPGPLLDTLLAFNRRVLETFPGFTGVTHHEMFVAEDGEVYLCEIGARAGGGGVIAGFLSRTGINLDEAMVRAQLGEPLPTTEGPADHLTGFIAVYAGPGTVREPIAAPDEPWVLESQILAEPGEVLDGPQNCNDAVAIVSVRGDSPEEVVRRLDRVHDHMAVALGSIAAG
ncbi:ATP-grasp domain-containing protein [Kitasatospora sp. NPDC050543]|uniref:ATP-grasp domain-containing protein n=1 Tax=Kitasatospora sp. NPDC050543 TaxID=3364054 RepID=UPI0037A0DD9A